MLRIISLLLLAIVACQSQRREGKSEGKPEDKLEGNPERRPEGNQKDKLEGSGCASKCGRAPDKDKQRCQDWCKSCKDADKSECINDKAREAHKAEVKQGTEKAEEARLVCKDVENSEQRRQCFQKEAAMLDQPRKDATPEERKKMYDNLKQYQLKVDEYEKDVRKSKMNIYFEDVKRNASRDDLERRRREMCSACVNGSNATADGNKTADGKRKMYTRKMCIDRCVERTLVDVEASNLKDCYENATTYEKKSACFCTAQGNDDVRKIISKASEASRVQGVTEYMCSRYMECMESKGIECREKLDSQLSMAKGSCTSRKEDIRMTLPQLRVACEKKQVEIARDQCREVLPGGDAKTVGECMRDTTGLSKGKIYKMERQNLKKRVKEEMTTCMSCNEGQSAEDCPPREECKNITKAALFEELGSDCEGNYMAFVEDGLEGDGEEVDAPLEACEVLIQFKKGKGQCRPEGNLRPGLRTTLGQVGSTIDGVVGVADSVGSTQIEKKVDGDMVQEATMVFKLRNLGNLTAEEIDEKCNAFAARMLSNSKGGRRLGQLESADVSDVTGSQASQTCLASDTSCQNSELAVVDGDSDGSTNGAPNGDDDGSSSSGAVRLSAAGVSIGFILHNLF